MRHEDGYCDRCGCEIGPADVIALTIDGEEHCEECERGGTPPKPARPEARDDGR